MLTRFVIILQIIAIVACPLACSSGWCCSNQNAVGGTAFSLDGPAPPTCCAHCTSTRCDDSPERPSETPAPGNCPEHQCQGICGGAVLEKPVELGTALGPHAILVDSSVAYQTLICTGRSLHPGQNTSGPATVYGCALRCLHMSLLC